MNKITPMWPLPLPRHVGKITKLSPMRAMEAGAFVSAIRGHGAYPIEVKAVLDADGDYTNQVVVVCGKHGWVVQVIDYEYDDGTR